MSSASQEWMTTAGKQRDESCKPENYYIVRQQHRASQEMMGSGGKGMSPVSLKLIYRAPMSSDNPKNDDIGQQTT
jgi:hypothetical protein